MAHDVPLVVPEVNAHTLREHKRIIAVPNCSALQMVTALQPIRKSFGLERIIVSTYQAVSGSGIHAIHELKEQAKSMLTGEEVKSTILPVKKIKNIIQLHLMYCRKWIYLQTMISHSKK